MSKTLQQNYELLKNGLERLSAEAVSVDTQQLLQYLEELKSTADQMKQELARVKGIRPAQAAERMSSKLKDALRE